MVQALLVALCVSLVFPDTLSGPHDRKHNISILNNTPPADVSETELISTSTSTDGGNSLLTTNDKFKNHSIFSKGLDASSSFVSSRSIISVAEDTTPQNSTSEDSTAAYSTSDDSNPKSSTSEDSTPIYSTSENSRPAYSTSEDSKLTYSTSEGSNPKLSTSEDSRPAYPTSEEPTPTYSTSEDLKPTLSTSEDSNPTLSTSEDSKPTLWTSENSTPPHSTPEDSKSKSSTSEDSALAHPTSGDSALAHPNSENSKPTISSEHSTSEHSKQDSTLIYSTSEDSTPAYPTSEVSEPTFPTSEDSKPTYSTSEESRLTYSSSMSWPPAQGENLPNRHLLFASENITQCFTTTETIHLTSPSGLTIVYASEPHSNTTGSFQSMAECLLIFTVPKGNVVLVDIVQGKIEEGCHSVFFDAYDLLNMKTLVTGYIGCKDGYRGPIHSFGNSVRIELRVYVDAPAEFLLNFTAVPETSRPELELRFTSDRAGSVETPRWVDDGYPPHMDSTVRLDVPAGHVIMISFPHVDIMADHWCRDDRLLLYEGGNSHRNVIKTICEKRSLAPEVLNTTVLYVRFVSFIWSFNSGTGFRLLFSFHDRQSQPEKLPGGTWNCSVPYWDDFKQHFPCDLQPQCANGEDELDCSYTTDTCGPGKITLNARCYLRIIPDALISWNDAAVTCLRQGMRLVSLNTPEEWQAWGKMLKRTDFVRVFTGLKSSAPFLPRMYQHIFQWSDGSIAYFMKIYTGKMQKPVCGSFRHGWFDDDHNMYLEECDIKRTAHILCEAESTPKKATTAGVSVTPIGDWDTDLSVVRCPDGHVTHAFLSCDFRSSCWASGSGSSVTCSLQSEADSFPAMFECDNGVQRIPFTLVCDYRPDCGDASDEHFCVHQACTFNAPFQCGNGQCLPMDQECDGMAQCVNGADEAQCIPFVNVVEIQTPEPPRVITFDGRGSFHIWRPDSSWYPINQNASNYCPETHFQCQTIFYCLPVYVRCNGVYDCPGKEDEAACDSYTCPGLYRCRGSKICLHPDDVCDAVFQCPEHDDELLCNFTCPQHCVCDGQSFSCEKTFHAGDFPELRFLDASGVDVSALDLRHNTLLIGLILADCNLTTFDVPPLPNLRLLDLRDNLLTSINGQYIKGLGNLKELILAGNPLGLRLFTELDFQQGLPVLQILDLSLTDLPELNASFFSVFPSLRILNMSGSNVNQVLGDGFQKLEKLRMLDLRGCPMSLFQESLFHGLTELEIIYADNYKLCCPDMLPSGSSLSDCQAPSDEISSCEALLRSDVYRVFLSAFAALALVGNFGSFLYRVFIQKATTGLGFDVFVTHLCVADFLMGVYLAVIGVADRLYQGTYLWNDVAWKESAACKAAGFLSLLSSEVSAFIICLITLDRFLVLRFPFSQLHFQKRSAQVACAVAWIAGVVLASTPLFPVTSGWQFYGQTGICLPLPITRNDFPGQDYSFVVMIVVNFVLFVLIAAGQVFIYWSIRSNSMRGADTTRKSKDLTIARRLITIAVTDFLCWFPIGLLGLLASNSVPVPGEVNVAMVIFILPLNSALNPFLYTLNVMLERRRLAGEARMKKIVESKIQTMRVSVTSQNTVHTAYGALDVIKMLLKNGSVSKGQIEEILSNPRQE